MKFLILLLSFNAFARPVVPDCRGDLASVGKTRIEDTGARNRLIAELAELTFATEAQNQAWIDDALAALAGDFHILIENSWLKKLNDKILKNKDLVTALTNLHKMFIIEELKNLGLPLKTAIYQDFKSTRLTLTDANHLAELQSAFVRATKRFYADQRVRAVVREEDLRESWFRMGVGKTEAEAALAARDARENGGSLGVSYFWDPKVSARLQQKFARVQDLHSQILARLNGTTLLTREENFTGLHLDIFAAARKATTNDFLTTLQYIFPQANLDQDLAVKILEYCTTADEFSPSVLVAKRELLTINHSPFGAFSLDFIGLGAENLRGTVKALVMAKNLGEAVRLTRQQEREITKIFETRKALVRRAVEEYFLGQVSIRFSGDDAIIIPERKIEMRDQLYLVQKLAHLLSRPYFRMALITAEGTATPDSSQIITHAENVEKVLRPLLVRQLGGARVDELSLEVFVPDTGKVRDVYLIMNGKKQITETEKEVVRNSFPMAVKIVEEAVRKQGLEIEYFPIEVIYVIFGEKPI